jgi:hypothetical protein
MGKTYNRTARWKVLIQTYARSASCPNLQHFQMSCALRIADDPRSVQNGLAMISNGGHNLPSILN